VIAPTAPPRSDRFGLIGIAVPVEPIAIDGEDGEDSRREIDPHASPRGRGCEHLDAGA
jgi:hypothetical protein